MRAVRIHEFGGPEVLNIEEEPKPSPGAGEVSIRVRASSVNPIDYKIRQGGVIAKNKLPVTLGSDVAGEIESAGAQVDEFSIADPVYAMLKDHTHGQAEFVTVDAKYCAPKPERLDFVQAAAVPLAALTAWQGLFDQGGLRRGQTVLIQGAAGGVGHFAVQFARYQGARVIAVCRGDDSVFAMRLGATKTIDYTTQRFEDEVKDVDLVFDLVGGEVQDRSWSVLKRGGVLVSTVMPPDEDKAREKGARGVIYMAAPSGPQLAKIGELIDAGEVQPYVDRVFPLERIADAEERLEREHVRGKLVVALM